MQQTELFDGVNRAQTLTDIRFIYGEKKRDALFLSLSDHISKDYLGRSSELEFSGGGERVIVKIKGDWLDISKHALHQLCSKGNLPIRFADFLQARKSDWASALLCRNLNELYSHKPPTAKFLLRSVDGTLRGFLSDRYALHLSTDPLIHRFNDFAIELGAKPIGATWSDVRLNLDVALPYLYRPFSEQNLLIGMSFFNSDFGAGTFTLSPSILDVDRNFTIAVPAEAIDSIKKIHLGPVLDDMDLNRVSSYRARRTDEQTRHMRRVMEQGMSKGYCEAVCSSIAKARDTEITWGDIKRQLFSTLLKEELMELEKRLKERSDKLPKIEVDADGLPIPTNWWAASAVGQLASEEPNPDRKIDLQYAAGKFIKL